VIPILLDPAFVRIGLAGRGALTLRRLGWFRALGVEPAVFSDAPDPELAAAAPGFAPRLPTDADLADLQALWAADLTPAESADLAARARARRVLVNLEDDLPHCDFHTPAVVRRGRLVAAVGTGGASPAAARAARERIEAALPEAWAEALDAIAAAREALRANGAGPAELAADARARLIAAGLIPR
jgi:precorrin-2 dehydrogenase/sirohydrochlorin ferrochelatase